MKIKEWFKYIRDTDTFYIEILEDVEDGERMLFYGDYGDLDENIKNSEFAYIDIYVHGEGILVVSAKIKGVYNETKR